VSSGAGGQGAERRRSRSRERVERAEDAGGVAAEQDVTQIQVFRIGVGDPAGLEELNRFLRELTGDLS
jgi:hypothetical protein